MPVVPNVPIPCLLAITTPSPFAALVVGTWAGALGLSGSFQVPPIAFGGAALLAGLERWAGEVRTRRAGVLVVMGALPGPVRAALDALRNENIRLLVEHRRTALHPPDYAAIIGSILQYDSGEAGAWEGRRYTLSVGGQTGYMYVTAGHYKRKPSNDKFDINREHWVWPAGHVWESPFTLTRTDEQEPVSRADDNEPHGHGKLVKRVDTRPQANSGEACLVHTSGSDRAAIFKKTGSRPRYFVSPALVDQYGYLAPTTLTFVATDASLLTQGEWWCFP